MSQPLENTLILYNICLESSRVFCTHFVLRLSAWILLVTLDMLALHKSLFFYTYKITPLHHIILYFPSSISQEFLF